MDRPHVSPFFTTGSTLWRQAAGIFVAQPSGDLIVPMPARAPDKVLRRASRGFGLAGASLLELEKSGASGV